VRAGRREDEIGRDHAEHAAQKVECPLKHLGGRRVFRREEEEDDADESQEQQGDAGPIATSIDIGIYHHGDHQRHGHASEKRRTEILRAVPFSLEIGNQQVDAEAEPKKPHGDGDLLWPWRARAARPVGYMRRRRGVRTFAHGNRMEIGARHRFMSHDVLATLRIRFTTSAWETSRFIAGDFR